MDPMARVLDIAPPTQDELARQRFISSLRKHVMVTLPPAMRADYEAHAAADFARKEGHEPADGLEVRKAMRHRPLYRAWSAMRYNAQEMVWASVQNQVERHLDELNETARKARDEGPGSLRLNPDLPLPREITSLDVHLMPGCWHEEHAEDDTAQGAVYELGSAVFGGSLHYAKRGAVAYSVANMLKIRCPDLKPTRILDIGCSIGTNTLPYHETYPDAELYGIDVAAAQLRHAFARACAVDVPVHFSQQDGEHTDFEDESFDLIVSSYLFHELSVKSSKAVLTECHRLLKPGGLMLHMELPASDQVDPYYNFFLDWDAYYNNEPHYASFRGQNLSELCLSAGFDADRYVLWPIPNYTTVDEDYFNACARGEAEPPAHGNGSCWYLFGAWK